MIRKYIPALVVLLLIGGLTGCSKDDPGDTGQTPAIELSDDEATATNGKISVLVSINHFNDLNFLEITKVDGSSVSTEKLMKADLSEEYTYNYTLKETDPQQFTFEFVATGNNGKTSAKQTLTVKRVSAESTVTLSDYEIRPDDSGSFSVTVTVSNQEILKELRITSEALAMDKTVKPEELNDGYNFQYKLTDNDWDYFDIIFTATDKSNRSDSKILTVDRRKNLIFTNLKCVSRITGAEINGKNGLPAVEFEVNNRTNEKYNVGGTDLGIVWELQPGRYGLFFGDTFGSDFYPNFANPGPNGGSWRSNVLLFSEDTDLSDGMTINGAATDISGKNAREICYGGKDGSGNGDWTSIPTAAIRANGIDYVHYMNIRNWTGWVTNYSSLYKSTDNGENWERCQDVRFGTNSNFGQAGYFKKDGYIYMVGTITGRDNSPHLARFREKDIEYQTQYEFWNRTQWIKGEESSATPLFNDNAGELSVAYHSKFGKWIMLYFNGPRYEITMRVANEITGPWGEP